MHPYQMRQLIQARHKDEVLDLKHGSLYHAIGRLLGDGLIEVVAVGRAGGRPERTTYRLTARGRASLPRWLRDRIAVPRVTPSEFVGLLSFLVHLAPDAVVEGLDARARLLEAETGDRALRLREAGRHVARINLVEGEYALAMGRAELAWVRSLADDIRTGHLRWDLTRILDDARTARKQQRRKTR